MKIFSLAKPKTSLVSLLHTRLRGYDVPHNIDAVHASDLTNEETEFCPREFALLRTTKKKRKQRMISTSLRHTFNMGVDLQRRITEQYLVDLMWGGWHCRSCETTVTFGKQPAECSQCCYARYIEVVVHDKALGIQGGLDALVEFSPNDIRLVEIKSIDKDYARKLKAPYAEHRVRTRLYLYLLEKSFGRVAGVNTQIAHVLYIAKSFGFKTTVRGSGDLFSPFIEYAVTRDDSELAPYLAKARCLSAGVTSQQMPHGVCSSSACKRAQQCNVVAECFGGQYPWQIPIQ